MSATFRSLSEPNYRNWFAGVTVSNTGQWMQRTAQDWVVLTMLTDHDSVALGLTMALQMLPQLLLFPFTGALSDRFDKRHQLMVTKALMGCTGLLLFVLTVGGWLELWHVYATALFFGVVATWDAPNRQTFVSELVGEKLLPNAVALNSASFNSARLVGPAVAGVLTVVLGAGPVFLLSGLGFFGVIVGMLLMDTGRLRRSERRRQGGLRGLVGGFRYIAGRSDLAVVLAILFVITTLGFNFGLYTATMASIEFGQDAGGFGLMNSVMAVGSLAGALIAARRANPRLRRIFLFAGGFGLACLVASVMPTYVTFVVALVAIGFSSVSMMTQANAYIQMTTPAHVRGRVMSIHAAVIMGGTPLGAPLAGWAVDLWGPRVGLLIAGAAGVVGILIGAGWMVTAKHMRVRRVSRLRLHLSYDGHP
ncbi:MFS transporter [Brevibacterium litoralis]|uniref:MFS transporter n=1 Tax=Brevibacterium litoralis TaxID=3138935 RepID=UPI0032EB2CCD